MRVHSSIYPPPLQKGDMIGIMSPSSWIASDILNHEVTFLQSQGYQVYVHPQTAARKGQMAGSAEDKIQALHDLLRNPEIKAIVSSCGGNRALTMLDGIDYDLILASPKIIMGYSDVTALLNAIWHKTGLVTFHGAVLSGLSARQNRQQIFDVLSGQYRTIPLPDDNIIHQGQAQGILIGGNLSILEALTGTDYQPDTQGAILFIEDCGDHLSRYDRMITHMKLAGWFDHIHGLIVGQFTETQDDIQRPFGVTLEEVIAEHFQQYNIPILMNAPFGHGRDLVTLPIGMQASLIAHPDQSQLSFLP